jgi:hypothetical protein
MCKQTFFAEWRKNVDDSAALHVFNANLIAIAVEASVKLAKVPATRVDTTDKHEPKTVL